MTPAVWGVPTASDRGDRIRSGPQVGKLATSPLPPGGPHRFRAGGQNPKWPTSGQRGYITPAASGGPHRFRAGGQNQKWPTSGQGGYINPAAWGVPTASERGDRIRIGPQVGKVATSPLPPRGVPTASERGDRIRIGPQVGKMATLPLPLGGPQPLQSGGTESELAHKWARWLHHPCRLGGPHRFRSGGQNQKWPTSGQGGYITPAASGVPTASERGERIRMGHKWARWLHYPCHLGVPTASERGDRIRVGPQVGKVATSPLPSGGSPPLQSGGAESEVANKLARWLHHPCRLGVPTASERGDRIRSGPQVGKVATSPLPPRGSPPLPSGGQNQKWPTSGQGGYITPAVWGVPTASERGDRIRSSPKGGKVATSPLPPRGSPPLPSGEQNQKWPTSGQGGYITPAVWGVPTASERGDRIRSGPQVGKVAT